MRAKITDLLPEISLRRWQKQHPTATTVPREEVYSPHCRHFVTDECTVSGVTVSVCVQCGLIPVTFIPAIHQHA